jgi:hypothetical protein
MSHGLLAQIDEGTLQLWPDEDACGFLETEGRLPER